jgi:hypothetical protein
MTPPKREPRHTDLNSQIYPTTKPMRAVCLPQQFECPTNSSGYLRRIVRFSRYVMRERSEHAVSERTVRSPKFGLPTWNGDPRKPRAASHVLGLRRPVSRALVELPVSTFTETFRLKTVDVGRRFAHESKRSSHIAEKSPRKSVGGN